MILSSSGFNVYPSEIEQVLALHPMVSESAVIGVRHKDGSELIKAIVVPKDDALSADDLLTHCRRYLASYKMPRRIEFRRELPRSILGKTLHRILRVEAEAQTQN